MSKSISILFIFCTLSACTVFSAKTPSQRYYALKTEYERALITAVAYKQNCDTRISEDVCHHNVDKIRKINARIAATFNTADNIGLETATSDLNAALISIQAGLQELVDYLLKLEVN